jgi:hypothetical protein
MSPEKRRQVLVERGRAGGYAFALPVHPEGIDPREKLGISTHEETPSRCRAGRRHDDLDGLPGPQQGLQWPARLEHAENDMVNELVILGITIIPIYSLAYLADIIVLNTIDYWSNDMTISDTPR